MKPAILLVIIISIGLVSEGTNIPFGDVRNCPTKSPIDDSQPLYQMEVLPGIGHDNLRSIDMGQILNYNFSQCHISKDGKYLLPDGVYLIPIQNSIIETSAEYFDHWDEYTSTTSFSLSVYGEIHVGPESLDTKFSAGYTHIKSHMYIQKSKMTRAQIRYRLYTVSMQPGAQLHPAFKARLYDIAAYLQNNDTKQARFLSETIVRDYGTHCITSLEAGAVIEQTSFIRSLNLQDSSNDYAHITQSASAVLLLDVDDVPVEIKMGEKLSFSFDRSHISGFLSNRVHSQTSTIGGPPYRTNFSLSDWEAGIADSLVAIDRSGVPLHYIINDNTLPELPPLTVQMLSGVIYEAIQRYYRVNTRYGCTDPSAKNFNFQANIDHHNCNYSSDNFTFGGIFQKCTMDPKVNYKDLCTGGPHALQKNPLTDDFSCPANYEAVKLQSTIIQVANYVSHQECHHTWYTLGIGKKCKTVISPAYSRAYFDAYWCAARPGAQIPNKTGYLFGGLYTERNSNPVTNTNGCPRFFIPLNMGEDIRVCVSDDYERAYAKSVPFAGFHSCESGNPLAAIGTNASKSSITWPHECPIGYTQHLVSVVDGCEINYCVQLGSFAPKTLLPPYLPPFHKQPKHKLNSNSSDVMILVGANGGLWAKDSTGKWVNYVEPSTFSFSNWYSLEPAENDTDSSPTVRTKKGGSSSAAIAVGSIIGTLALVTVITAVVFIGRRVSKKKKQGGEEKYIEINKGQSHPLDLTTENA